MKDRRHIIISGPSGSGKSTITKKLVTQNPLFKFSVSHTTREMRPGEENGKDYFFISMKTFKDMIKRDSFIEYAIYNGNYYGTAVSELESKVNAVCILDLERQGVENLMRYKFDFRYIFIYADKETLLERLIKRKMKEKNEKVIGLCDLKEISNRVGEAEKDLKVYERGIYDLGVENVDLDKTVEKICEYLYKDTKLIN